METFVEERFGDVKSSYAVLILERCRREYALVHAHPVVRRGQDRSESLAKPVGVEHGVLRDAGEPVASVHVDVRQRSRQDQRVTVPAVHATDGARWRHPRK